MYFTLRTSYVVRRMSYVVCRMSYVVCRTCFMNSERTTVVNSKIREFEDP